MTTSQDATNITGVAMLQARYCRAVDDHAGDLLRTTVTDDVRFVAGDGTTLDGAEAVMDYFEAFWATLRGRGTHLVTNVELVDADGDALGVHCYFQALMTSGRGITTVVWGRYRDEVVVDGEGTFRIRSKIIETLGRGTLG